MPEEIKENLEASQEESQEATSPESEMTPDDVMAIDPEATENIEASEDAETKTDASEAADTGEGSNWFKDTIASIKNGLTGKSDEDISDSAKEAAASDSAIASDIPDTFAAAAEALGWESQDIIDFASEGNGGKPYTDQELLDMVPELMAAAKNDVAPEVKPDAEIPASEVKPDVEGEPNEDPNAVLRAEIKAEILKDLNITEIKEDLDRAKAEREQEAQTQQYNRANELFDDASKEIPTLGKTADLPKYPSGTNKGQIIQASPQFKARAEVYNDAMLFMAGGSLSFDEAMKKSVATYRGTHLKDETRHAVLKDLKKHERNLSGSRTNKEVKKTYTSARDEDIDYIRQLQSAAGQDG